MSILINRGDGTFDAQSLYEVAQEPTRAEACDINNDGFKDILFSSTSIVRATGFWASVDSSSHIAVLLNKGNGTFSTQVLFQVGISPKPLTLSDVNNDDLIDILVSNGSTGDVSVLINSGNF